MDQVTKEQADRIEGKLDKLLAFADKVEKGLDGFMSGPGAKIMATMVRGMGGGGR